MWSPGNFGQDIKIVFIPKDFVAARANQSLTGPTDPDLVERQPFGRLPGFVIRFAIENGEPYSALNCCLSIFCVSGVPDDCDGFSRKRKEGPEKQLNRMSGILIWWVEKFWTKVAFLKKPSALKIRKLDSFVYFLRFWTTKCQRHLATFAAQGSCLVFTTFPQSKWSLLVIYLLSCNPLWHWGLSQLRSS